MDLEQIGGCRQVRSNWGRSKQDTYMLERVARLISRQSKPTQGLFSCLVTRRSSASHARFLLVTF
jgi:hypothetical protein